MTNISLLSPFHYFVSQTNVTTIEEVYNQYNQLSKENREMIENNWLNARKKDGEIFEEMQNGLNKLSISESRIDEVNLKCVV